LRAHTREARTPLGMRQYSDHFFVDKNIPFPENEVDGASVSLFYSSALFNLGA
jgi:hypothetical protein